MGQNLDGFRSAPTISRGRRCENCIHFDNGVLAIQHYKAKRFAELTARAKKIIEASSDPRIAKLVNTLSTKVRGKDVQTRDFTDLDQAMQTLGVNYELGDTLMRQGVIGLCRISALPGDFIHKNAFCGTKYEAKVKVEGSETPDETGDEARARLGLEKD